MARETVNFSVSNRSGFPSSSAGMSWGHQEHAPNEASGASSGVVSGLGRQVSGGGIGGGSASLPAAGQNGPGHFSGKILLDGAPMAGAVVKVVNCYHSNWTWDPGGSINDVLNTLNGNGGDPDQVKVTTTNANGEWSVSGLNQSYEYMLKIFPVHPTNVLCAANAEVPNAAYIGPETGYIDYPGYGNFMSTPASPSGSTYAIFSHGRYLFDVPCHIIPVGGGPTLKGWLGYSDLNVKFFTRSGTFSTQNGSHSGCSASGGGSGANAAVVDDLLSDFPSSGFDLFVDAKPGFARGTDGKMVVTFAASDNRVQAGDRLQGGYALVIDGTTSASIKLYTVSGGSGTSLYDPGRKEVAFQLLSSAENSTLDWRSTYGYIEDIGDGRGYTAGISGFCSGTGDMLLVVDRYMDLKPTGNTLAPYYAALVSVNGTDSHAGLGTPFTSAWTAAAAAEPLFRQAQDEIRQELYFSPAVDLAISDGLGALGQFCYFDHAILNGYEGMTEGIRDVVIGNGVLPPAQGGNENTYLNAWLIQAIVQMDTDPAHSDHSRVIAQQKFRSEGKFGLQLPLSWSMYGDGFIITSVTPPYSPASNVGAGASAQIADSSYSSWVMGDTIHIRIRRVGTNIKVYLWKNSESQPGSPSIDITEGTYTGPAIALGTSTGASGTSRTGDWSNLVVLTGADIGGTGGGAPKPDVESTTAGFTGSGYVNLNSAGEGVRFVAMQPPSSGLYSCSIRYLAALAATCEITVNGSVAYSGLTLEATAGSLSTNAWGNKNFQVQLNAGLNVIQVKNLSGTFYMDSIKLGDKVTTAPPPSSNTLPIVQANNPGYLVAAQSRGSQGGGTAYNIEYKMTGITGALISATACAIVPTGTAPTNGWRVVTVGHGATGAADENAPSLNTGDLAGEIAANCGNISALLGAGFVVVMADYEGMGGEPDWRHPYMVGISAGRSLIDAARACAGLPGVKINNRLAAWGFSQGGHAALWVGELIATGAYGTEFNPVVVAIDPVIPTEFVSSTYADWGAYYGLLNVYGQWVADRSLTLGEVVDGEAEYDMTSIEDDYYGQGTLTTNPTVPSRWAAAFRKTDPGFQRGGKVLHLQASNGIGAQSTYVGRAPGYGTELDHRVLSGEHDSSFVASVQSTALAWVNSRIPAP